MLLRPQTGVQGPRGLQGVVKFLISSEQGVEGRWDLFAIFYEVIFYYTYALCHDSSNDFSYLNPKTCQ